METRRDERIGRLLQALRHNDKLHLKEAATLLGVSEMTIRHNLNNHDAPVMLLMGYIVLEPHSANHYLINDQKSHLVNEKRCTVQQATSLAQTHWIILFDCGTTTPRIIEAVDNRLPFTAIYYSLNTFLILQEKPRCRVILCDGEFHASNVIFKPLDSQKTLNNPCPDVVFYPVAGVHIEKGATCLDLEELPVKHWATSMTQRHILVVDHNESGKV